MVVKERSLEESADFWARAFAQDKAYVEDFLSAVFDDILKKGKFRIKDYQRETENWKNAPLAHRTANKYLKILTDAEVLEKSREGQQGAWIYRFNPRFRWAIEITRRAVK